MIIFKHKRNNKYLITNYKVMFSTLVDQPNLYRVNNKSFISHKILEQFGFRQKASVHFLIRNPEQRLQSFFHNKFRQHIEKSNFSDWEHCQRIFFDHLEIEKSDAPKLIKEKILNFSYSQFIQTLSDHYLKDAHLIPQSKMTSLSIMGIVLPIKNKPDEVYIMEEEKDIIKLEQTFDLNLSHKINVSHKDFEEFSVSKELEQTVRKIYKEDYKMYSNWS